MKIFEGEDYSIYQYIYFNVSEFQLHKQGMMILK